MAKGTALPSGRGPSDRGWSLAATPFQSARTSVPGHASPALDCESLSSPFQREPRNHACRDWSRRQPRVSEREDAIGSGRRARVSPFPMGWGKPDARLPLLMASSRSEGAWLPRGSNPARVVARASRWKGQLSDAQSSAGEPSRDARPGRLNGGFAPGTTLWIGLGGGGPPRPDRQGRTLSGMRFPTVAATDRWAVRGPLRGLPDDGKKYELEAGRLVSEPLPGYRHGRVMFVVARSWTRTRPVRSRRDHRRRCWLRAGPATRTPVRGPDVAFVTEQRLAPSGDRTQAFEGAPDLARRRSFPPRTHVPRCTPRSGDSISSRWLPASFGSVDPRSNGDRQPSYDSHAGAQNATRKEEPSRGPADVVPGVRARVGEVLRALDRKGGGSRGLAARSPGGVDLAESRGLCALNRDGPYRGP
jgi:hypothetical protein